MNKSFSTIFFGNSGLKNTVLFLALFAVFFWFYAGGVCGGSYWGDSGEIITAGRVLGILHPPGHPVYPMLGRSAVVLTGLPAEIAVSLLSPFFGALTAAIFPFLLIGLFPESGSSGKKAALAAGVLFGLSPAMIVYSRIPELYSAVFMFFILFVLAGSAILHTCSSVEKSWRLLMITVWVAGIGAGIHALLFILTTPLLFFLSMIVMQRSKRWKYRDKGVTMGRGGSVISPGFIIPVLGVWLLSVSIFLYLPLRGGNAPALIWGVPDTLRGLLDNITMRDFRSSISGMKYMTGDGLRDSIFRSLELISGEVGIVTMVGGFIGMIVVSLCKPSTGFMLIILFFLTLVTASVMGGGMVQDAYLFPAVIVIAALAFGLIVFVPIWFFKGVRENKTTARGIVFWSFFVFMAVGAILSGWSAERYSAKTGWSRMNFSMDDSASLYADLTVDFMLGCRDSIVGSSNFPGPGPEDVRENMKRIHEPFASKENKIVLFTDDTVDYFTIMESISRRGITGVSVNYVPVENVCFPFRGDYDCPTKADIILWSPRGALKFPVGRIEAAGPFFLLKNEDIPDIQVVPEDLDRGIMSVLDSLLIQGDYHALKRLSIIHGHRGDYFYKSGQIDKALEEFGTITGKIDPGNAAAWYDYGIIVSGKEGPSPKTVSCFRKAANLMPENETYKSTLAKELLSLEWKKMKAQKH